MEKEVNLSPKQFIIHFHGNFIPLQGVHYIIKAAKILENENLTFNIIGAGFRSGEIKKLAEEMNLKNINFLGRVSLKDIPVWISKADICLGIFGDTPKTQRVIPNKVYEAIAMKKPVVTGETPAIIELFENRKNILLCQVADPKDLAAKILELKNNPDLRKTIANEGYELFKEFATPQKIGQELIKNLDYLSA